MNDVCLVCRITIFFGVREGHIDMPMTEIRKEARLLGIKASNVKKQQLLENILAEYYKRNEAEFNSCCQAMYVDADFFASRCETGLKFSILPWNE